MEDLFVEGTSLKEKMGRTQVREEALVAAHVEARQELEVQSQLRRAKESEAAAAMANACSVAGVGSGMKQSPRHSEEVDQNSKILGCFVVSFGQLVI